MHWKIKKILLQNVFPLKRRNLDKLWQTEDISQYEESHWGHQDSHVKEDLNSLQSVDVKLSRIYVTNNTGVKKPAGYSSAGWLTTSWRTLWNKEKACPAKNKAWLAKKHLRGQKGQGQEWIWEIYLNNKRFSSNTSKKRTDIPRVPYSRSKYELWHHAFTSTKNFFAFKNWTGRAKLEGYAKISVDNFHQFW